eukprot:TRINITY_DN468_c1_g1_i4.p1 TRINITY_DN468_c1_g1~~TRINITY_DN468_c1_g1_i4.p1  ORF type:complete len:150 (+),score=17.71 TRINITY_DN468_c1_g1_i4:172-621(+)
MYFSLIFICNFSPQVPLMCARVWEESDLTLLSAANSRFATQKSAKNGPKTTKNSENDAKNSKKDLKNTENGLKNTENGAKNTENAHLNWCEDRKFAEIELLASDLGKKICGPDQLRVCDMHWKENAEKRRKNSGKNNKGGSHNNAKNEL